MIIPTNENILVTPLQREVKTSTGIILGNTSTTQEGLQFGEVIHPGKSQYKKGDKIFYSLYSAVWVNDKEGKAYQMLCHLDVMGIEK